MPIACFASPALHVRRRRCTEAAVDQHKRVTAGRCWRLLLLLAADLRVPVSARSPPTTTTPRTPRFAATVAARIAVFRPDMHYGSAHLVYARQSRASGPGLLDARAACR